MSSNVDNFCLTGFFNEKDEDVEDKTSKQLLEIEDGNVDLVILLGFDQDIYSDEVKYRNETNLKNYRT